MIQPLCACCGVRTGAAGAAAAADTIDGHAEVFSGSVFGVGQGVAACGGSVEDDAAGLGASFGASLETDWVEIVSSPTGIIGAEGPSDAVWIEASLTFTVLTAIGLIGSVEPGAWCGAAAGAA